MSYVSSSEDEYVAEPTEHGTKRSFENLLDRLSHFGLYQKIIFVLLKLCTIMHNTVFTFAVYSTATPIWRCLEFDMGSNNSHVTTSTIVNLSFEQTCSFNGFQCAKFEFQDPAGSIVSEVSDSNVKHLLHLRQTFILEKGPRSPSMIARVW
jgi:hypothetical protein